MAHATRVSQNIVAALVRKSELRSGDIADHDHHHISHRMAGVVCDGSRDGKRLWCLGRRALLCDGGDEKQRDEQA